MSFPGGTVETGDIAERTASSLVPVACLLTDTQGTPREKYLIQGQRKAVEGDRRGIQDTPETRTGISTSREVQTSLVAVYIEQGRPAGGGIRPGGEARKFWATKGEARRAERVATWLPSVLTRKEDVVEARWERQINGLCTTNTPTLESHGGATPGYGGRSGDGQDPQLVQDHKPELELEALYTQRYVASADGEQPQPGDDDMITPQISREVVQQIVLTQQGAMTADSERKGDSASHTQEPVETATSHQVESRLDQPCQEGESSNVKLGECLALNLRRLK